MLVAFGASNGSLFRSWFLLPPPPPPPPLGCGNWPMFVWSLGRGEAIEARQPYRLVGSYEKAFDMEADIP